MLCAGPLPLAKPQPYRDTRCNMERNETAAADTAHFFLPDLCDRRAVGVLVLVAELLAIVLALAGTGLTADFWENLGLTSLFVQWIALSSAAVLCRLKPWLATLQARTAAIAVYGVIVVDALIFSMLAQYLYGSILRPASPGGTPSSTLVLTHVLIAAIIGGLILRYFYVQEQLRRQKEAGLQARIQALQSRIRPHFLFNSMNIIASLIATDPDTAENVVLDLADLFRASLRDAGDEVTLAHELDLCRRYIRIEQLRIGDRLQVDWRLGDTPLDEVRIPLLTLQPLIENAIYHGIQPLAGEGTVTISVGYNNNEVRISVTNPVVPPTLVTTGHQGNRMALDNIRYRLSALYGPAAGVVSVSNGETYGTTLHYPFKISR